LPPPSTPILVQVNGTFLGHISPRVAVPFVFFYNFSLPFFIPTQSRLRNPDRRFSPIFGQEQSSPPDFYVPPLKRRPQFESLWLSFLRAGLILLLLPPSQIPVPLFFTPQSPFPKCRRDSHPVLFPQSDPLGTTCFTTCGSVRPYMILWPPLPQESFLCCGTQFPTRAHWMPPLFPLLVFPWQLPLLGQYANARRLFFPNPCETVFSRFPPPPPPPPAPPFPAFFGLGKALSFFSNILLGKAPLQFLQQNFFFCFFPRAPLSRRGSSLFFSPLM